MEYVPLALDKHTWRPSPLPGQIVLVTTIDASGAVDVAPKSWVTMAAFAGPVIGFGCNLAHATARNAADTGEFVVNVVGEELADAVWAMPMSHGAARIERAGLTLRPASEVRPPVVDECVAHFECRHLLTVTIAGDEVYVFGTVVAAAIAQDATSADAARSYAALAPLFFLEDGLHAPLGTPRPHQPT